MSKKDVTVAAVDSQEPAAAITAPALCVVVESRPGYAHETELTLRSLEVFLMADYRLVLIGEDLTDDVLKTFKDKVVCIPFDFTEDETADYIEMVKMLCACEEVSGRFIFVPQMCWLIDRIGLQHIQVAKYCGMLKDTCQHYPTADLVDVMSDTLDLLNGAGYPFDPIDCHTGYPVYLDKAYVIDALGFIGDRNVDFFSIYGNMLRSIQHPVLLRLEDDWGLNVKSASVTAATFSQHVIRKCFLRTEVAHIPQMLDEYVRGMVDDDDDE